MKYLYLVRHAKSSWSNPKMKDYERPLNKRGRHDAPKMANLLHNLIDGQLDFIYSSHANRAMTTAKEFHGRFHIKEDIDIRRDIYYGDMSDVIHILQETDNRYNNIAIFGHNPTFTYLLNFLACANIDNLPTCGIGMFQLNVDDWKNLDPETIELKEVLLPKKLLY